ncbi:MAG: hypothetical protein WA891_03945, partial [Acidobacteriaceae bacterium]
MDVFSAPLRHACKAHTQPLDLPPWIRTELIRISGAEGKKMGRSRHTEAQIIAALKQVEAGR